MSSETKLVRTMIGKVVGTQMHKTIKVIVERKFPHPLYGKYVKKYTKLFVHDENNQCHVGDMVLIKESRPISKNKNWMLVEIIANGSKQ